jgi:hypothetical protein
MSDGHWLKDLLMVPGRLHIAVRAIAHRIKHARLNSGGDPAKRGVCCDPRPASFPEGKGVEDIPELEGVLKQTGYLLSEYYPAYRCTVCGQEWFRDWEQLKSGGYIHVRKST